MKEKVDYKLFLTIAVKDKETHKWSIVEETIDGYSWMYGINLKEILIAYFDYYIYEDLNILDYTCLEIRKDK